MGKAAAIRGERCRIGRLAASKAGSHLPMRA